LTPPCGRLGREREVLVDPDVAELERLRHAHRPADVAREHDDARPYGVSFAQAIAWSSSLNRWTVTTGPKISSWMISDCWSGPAMTVGS
jgi:hypothetical protein